MNQQKGFSLTEVLVSLMLVTTLALALLQQQTQSRQLLNQMVLRVQGSQFLDQIEETLTGHVNKIPPAPLPYHLTLKQQKQGTRIQLSWSSQTSISRVFGNGQ